MYGGARQLEAPQQTDMFILGDIGDYKNVDDIVAISSASLIGMNLGVLLSKFGGLGGYSLNMYFDTFGLEGILANTSFVVILFQIARWFYTTFYAVGRPWSPFVFVCVLMSVEIIHDLIFYYGPLKTIPAGKNEMIDALKRYAAENGSRALTGHLAFLIVVGILAMFLKESSVLFTFILVSISLYILPFLLTTSGPKPPPPPPPPPKKDPYEQGMMGQRF
jgi:hypothetical protein